MKRRSMKLGNTGHSYRRHGCRTRKPARATAHCAVHTTAASAGRSTTCERRTAEIPAAARSQTPPFALPLRRRRDAGRQTAALLRQPWRSPRRWRPAPSPLPPEAGSDSPPPLARHDVLDTKRRHRALRRRPGPSRFLLQAKHRSAALESFAVTPRSRRSGSAQPSFDVRLSNGAATYGVR